MERSATLPILVHIIINYVIRNLRYIMSIYEEGKTPPLRIVKQYGHFALPGSPLLYMPQYSSKAFWSNKVVWRSFMINTSGRVVPIDHFHKDVIKSLSRLEYAEKQIQAYRERFLDDNVVYELKPVGELNDGDTIQTG